ncbi:MAG: hypothetical protein IT384_23055 [Deltaproteobacteria bacterium]|nr:hypothetical protein [Deltaproteobacteria bacterium]
MADIRDKWPFPANVGLLGTYPEEVKALQRSPEKNPDAAPMPQVAPLRFLSPLKSSEDLRMGEPDSPIQLPENGTIIFTHVVIRRFLKKARRRGVVLFDDAVESEPLIDTPENRRDQMKAMLARERALLELLDRYNALAEGVYAQLLAGAKG